MPYRRSRLQDYYDQLLGRKPAKPKPKDSTPTHSPFLDFGNPPPSQSPHKAPVTSPRPVDSEPSPHLTQEATRYAQPPSSDEEAERRKQRIEEARQRFDNARQPATTPPSPPVTPDPPDIDEIRSRYVSGVEEITIHPIDIELKLAARYNPVLNEIQCMRLLESIPPTLQSNPDLLLNVCAEFGIDEENDAEAREYLRCLRDDGSQHQNADDPLAVARDEVLDAFGTDNAEASFTAYKTAVEAEYGIEFTVAESATEWNLANVVMTHAALEMAAHVFGNRLRDLSGLAIDDATAFRLIFGPITLNHSTVKKTAHAEVFGPLVDVYWNEDKDRNYNLYPYVFLHELGHRFNLLAGLGVREGYGSLSINEHTDHPRSRAGMGESAQRPLQSVLGVSKYHGMYDEAEIDPTHVEMLQYGEQSDHNEVTADSVLNWIVHQASGGVDGFVNTADGQRWLEFMDSNMDAWIKNAIVFNAHRQGKIASLAEEGLILPVAGTGTVSVLAASTATARSTHSKAGDAMAHLRLDEEVLLLGESEPDNEGYRWNAVWADDIYWVRYDLVRETWTERQPMTVEKARQWFPTLLELLTRR